MPTLIEALIAYGSKSSWDDLATLATRAGPMLQKIKHDKLKLLLTILPDDDDYEGSADEVIRGLTRTHQSVNANSSVSKALAGDSELEFVAEQRVAAIFLVRKMLEDIRMRLAEGELEARDESGTLIPKADWLTLKLDILGNFARNPRVRLDFTHDYHGLDINKAAPTSARSMVDGFSSALKQEIKPRGAPKKGTPAYVDKFYELAESGKIPDASMATVKALLKGFPDLGKESDDKQAPKADTLWRAIKVDERYAKFLESRTDKIPE